MVGLEGESVDEHDWYQADPKASRVGGFLRLDGNGSLSHGSKDPPDVSDRPEQV